MKIRIVNNSMRFRISEEELLLLEKGGTLEEKLEFPNDKELIIQLENDKNIKEEFDMIFNENIILLKIHNFILEEIKGSSKAAKLENSKLVCYVEVDFHKHK